MDTEMKNIKVVYSHLPPFVEIHKENGKDTLKGFMPEIVSSILKWMHLSIEWIREPTDNFGSWENNTWTGIRGMLYRNDVDIILNPLRPSSKYAEVAFYTNPVFYGDFTILSGKEDLDSGLFLYFSVLQPIVWTAIGITLVVLILISAVLYQRITDPSETWLKAVNEYFWIYVGYMLRQAPGKKWIFLKSKRRRMLQFLLPLLVTMWVIGVAHLIMSIFQSLLFSKLTIVRSKPVVDSIEEFLSKKNVIGRAPREMHTTFKGSNITVYEETWIKLEPELVDFEELFSDESYAGLEAGRLCIFQGKRIIWTALSEYFQDKGTCNFHISRNEFSPFPLLMTLRKGLPREFTNRFNYGLTRLIDADLTGKWFKPIIKITDLCTSYTDNTLKPLTLKHIYGVMLIWTVSICMSVIVLIIEILIHSKKHSKSHRHRRH